MFPRRKCQLGGTSSLSGQTKTRHQLSSGMQEVGDEEGEATSSLIRGEGAKGGWRVVL